jgi:hypothetical protein
MPEYKLPPLPKPLDCADLLKDPSLIPEKCYSVEYIEAWAAAIEVLLEKANQEILQSVKPSKDVWNKALEAAANAVDNGARPHSVRIIRGLLRR